MTRQDIFEQIRQKESYLCVGLDTNIQKIPSGLRDFSDPVFEFNRRIVDATADFCMSYKLNLAFYESLGPEGLISLRLTLRAL